MEFQRDKNQAYSIFHAEFKSSAKKILVLWEGGQNKKKHLVQYFCEYDFFFTFDKFFICCKKSVKKIFNPHVRNSKIT